MALLQDLIRQIDDETLRQRIMAEVNKLSRQKKFGLIFEEHLPECTPLYGVKIKKGSKAARKTGQVSDIYIVRSIEGDKAICEHKTDHAEAEFALDDLVAVAEFGEPIYPCLKPIDTICNAPDSDLWHTLIEADNYHALQLLEYLYAGKVDCIYIETPDDTGTGTNYKGLVLYDLAVLALTALPAIGHDSLILKNVSDGSIDGIMRIYESFQKQIFIAFDKQDAYQENTVLKLSDGGGELYGYSWNTERGQ